MAGKQVTGDSLSASLAGMTKNQLHDIMSQMKMLIEQNQQQARQILIQNPLLTKALFQAQIMLGMVQPSLPQAVPNIQPPVTQPTQQSAQPTPPQPNPHLSSGQVNLEDHSGPVQTQGSIRKQHPPMPVPSPSFPTANLHSQPMPTHPPQPPLHQRKGHPMTSMPLPSQSSHAPPLPLHPPPSLHQSQMSASTQLQQPPLPLQPRPPTMPTYHHQFAPPMGPNMGFQHHGAPQHHLQPMFHSGGKPPASIGHQFPQRQQPSHPPSHLPPPQPVYQAGGSHLGGDFNNQVGIGGADGGGPSWMPDGSTMSHIPMGGQSQMGPGNQPPRPAALTPDMEKALLQQVMSLTPEQINLLPPEQRNQVFQLQHMLHQ